MSTFDSQYNNKQSPLNQLVYGAFHWGVTKAYPIDNAAIVYPIGTPVRLTATGTVALCAPGQRPFGFVTVANRLNDTDYSWANYVTIAECGVLQHAIGYADTAAVNTGSLVTSLGTQSNDPDYSDYRTAASGEYAFGMCVAGAADGSQIEIAIFAQPFLLP